MLVCEPPQSVYARECLGDSPAKLTCRPITGVCARRHTHTCTQTLHISSPQSKVQFTTEIVCKQHQTGRLCSTVSMKRSPEQTSILDGCIARRVYLESRKVSLLMWEPETKCKDIYICVRICIYSVFNLNSYMQQHTLKTMQD